MVSRRVLGTLGASLLPQLALAQTYDYSTGDSVSGAAALGGLAFLIIWLVVGIAAFVFWLVMLIDAIRREFSNPNDKVLWIVLMVIFGILGAIIYYFAGRPKGTLPQGPKPAAASSPPPPTEK